MVPHSHLVSIRASFVYLHPFLNTITNIVQNLTIDGKSVAGVLGIQTCARGMDGRRRQIHCKKVKDQWPVKNQILKVAFLGICNNW